MDWIFYGGVGQMTRHRIPMKAKRRAEASLDVDQYRRVQALISRCGSAFAAAAELGADLRLLKQLCSGRGAPLPAVTALLERLAEIEVSQ